MNKFQRGSAAVLASMALWMVSGASLGMGLGHPVSRAILGDTLSVSVPVRLEPGEDLTADCIKADVYFGDDKVSAQSVQTQLKVTAAPIGRTPEAVIQIRTTSLINEPVVTVYVVAGCQLRITRKFVTLVDPPDLKAPVVGASASPQMAPGSTTHAADTGAAVVPHDARPVQSVRDPVSKSSGLGRKAQSFSLSSSRQSATGAAASRSSKSSKDTKKGHGSAPSKPRADKAGVDAPRLVLDPVAIDATVNPGLQMTGGLTAPRPEAEASSPEIIQRRRSASAIWQAMNASPEEFARDRDRLQELERKLDALTQDSVRASEAVTGLQGRLTQRPAAGNGALYALGVLIVVLLGVMVWRERILRKALAEQSSWLTSQSPDDVDTPADGGLESPSLLSDIHDVVAQVDAELAVPPAEAPQACLSEEPAPAAAIAPLAPLVVPRQDNLRDVSVDELIDLEQHAEFFLVLGQDDSAIEVLEGYISGTTAASPMPFLKLLEIYRRLGLRGAYERTRMNFNLRFNAHAPLWDADMTHGHELKDYPGVIERLQALWPHPDKALQVLERSLMRQDAESYTFDLPAYRELLFLYAVLRDLAERHATHDGSAHHAPVDWLISSSPVGLADADLESPLMATLPMKAIPDLAPTLSLDLELDDLFVEPSNAPYKP